MAITITPTGKTGMDVGLADIASILSEQNQVLAQTADAQQKLTNSFSSYIGMLKGDKMDKLQQERREKTQTDTAQTSRMSGMTIGGALGTVSDYLKGFAKRLLPVALGILFGDDLIEAVKKQIERYLKTDLNNDVVNALSGAIGGGLAGFLFGGGKGAIYGMVLGTMFSTPVREKIAEALSFITGDEVDSTDWKTYLTAGAIGLAIPSLIQAAVTAVLPKLLGLLFSPAGLLVVAAGLAITTAYKYYTDPEFKKMVDEKTQGFNDTINDMEKAFANKIGEVITTYTNEAKKLANKSLGFNLFTTKEMEAQAEGALSNEDKSKLDQLRTQEAEVNKDFTDYLSGKRTDEIVAKYGLDSGITSRMSNLDKLEDIASGLRDAQDNILDPASSAVKATKGKSNQDIINKRNELAENAALLGSMPGNETEVNYLRKQIEEMDKIIATRAQPAGAPRPPTGMERQTYGPNPELMAKYGSRSTGNTIAPVDASNTNVVTNNSSTPMVLPSGGSQDYTDNKSKMFISGL